MPAPNVNIADGPSTQAYVTLYDYAGGANLIYTGKARSSLSNNQGALVVVSISKANPGVVNVVAHGLQTDNIVTVVGGAGSWAALNGPQIITVIDANNFSIPVDTSAYAGTFAGSISTLAPRSSKPVWSIQKYYYSGTNLVRSGWANGSTSEANIWDNRATLGYS